MIEALLAHRHVAHADLVAGLEAAGSAGALSADAVKITTRRLADAPTVQNWRILARCAGPGTGHEPGHTS